MRALLRSKFGERCDLVCRLDGSPRIIFAGHRCAEESDDLIPNYADYFSLKVADHPCHTVDRFAERFDGHLGVGRRLCRQQDLDCQNGDDTALSRYRVHAEVGRDLRRGRALHCLIVNGMRQWQILAHSLTAAETVA